VSNKSYLPKRSLALVVFHSLSLYWPRSSELEEIIVTANFRDTTLMGSVGSISVVAQDTITEQAAQRLRISSMRAQCYLTAGATRPICGIRVSVTWNSTMTPSITLR
jgi:hypothetical protein